MRVNGQFFCAALLVLATVGWDRPVGAQSGQVPLTTAAAATELPVPAWGPYSRSHYGPCFLADRARAQLFTFPIVVGQRRQEIRARLETGADGKQRLRTEKVALERRIMGLSPAQAAEDDRAPALSGGTRNRLARIVEANSEGLFWRAKAAFAPAAVVQRVSGRPGPDGQPAPPLDWSAGEAVIEWFPAFVEPNRDGLLIAVTLVNRSNAPQTYYVDLLGGMSNVAPAFTLPDLFVEPEADGNTVLLKHSRCPFFFALSARVGGFPVRTYRVGDDYFSREAGTAATDTAGVAAPAGRIASDGKDGRGRKNEKRRNDRKAENTPSNPADPGRDKQAEEELTTVGGNWGLTRVDDIALAPGQQVTVLLCIGIGNEALTARNSAQNLLLLAEDAAPDAKEPRPGLLAKARELHKKHRFMSGDEAVDRLMAQSLVNIPFAVARRVGVPSRMDTGAQVGGAYQSAPGGMIALGWLPYRPDWAAAQLNAFFLSRGDPDAPLPNPQAIPPTNLFALWELWQQTHDRGALTQLFPFARRRYQELLAAGRVRDGEALYAWPTAPETKAEDGKAETPRLFAPDYSAYVVRAAKIMRTLAEQARRDAKEIAGYEADARAAASALDATLWDATRGQFIARPVRAGDEAASVPDSLNGLLPLIMGGDSLKAAQYLALLKTLTDPAAFWSPAGIRSLSKASPAYRPDAPGSGAVSLGLNWLLWKALLDMGEADLARKLAEAVTAAYRKAEAEYGGCPEWLNGETGAGGGVPDYSGGACAVIPLYAAYHLPGTLSTGWDVHILSARYDKVRDSWRIVFRDRTAAGKGTLVCVMGRPNGKYTLTGALRGTATADAQGVLTLQAPLDKTTLALDIAPEAGNVP